MYPLQHSVTMGGKRTFGADEMFKSISTKQTFASSEWAASQPTAAPWAKLPFIDATLMHAFGYVATLRYNKLRRDNDACIASIRSFIVIFSKQVHHK